MAAREGFSGPGSGPAFTGPGSLTAAWNTRLWRVVPLLVSVFAVNLFSLRLLRPEQERSCLLWQPSLYGFLYLFVAREPACLQLGEHRLTVNPHLELALRGGNDLEGRDVVIVLPHHLFRQTDGFGEVVSQRAVFDFNVQLLRHPYPTPFLFMRVTARTVLQKRKILYLTQCHPSYHAPSASRAFMASFISSGPGI